MVNFNAMIAIWITLDPRIEHQKVVDWLNEVTAKDFSFYLVKVEIVKIGDSALAPLFTIVSKPDELVKELGQTKKEITEKGKMCREFWEMILPKMNEEGSNLFRNVSAKTDHWLDAGSGKSLVTFQFILRRHDSSVQVSMHKPRKEENKAIFDALFNKKAEIESELGHELRWSRRDDANSSCVVTTMENGWADKSHWNEMAERMVEMMIKFEKSFKHRIKRIKV